MRDVEERVFQGWGFRQLPAAPEAAPQNMGRLLALLNDGPGCSTEFADELGLPMRQVSAMLSSLYRRKKATRTVFRQPGGGPGRYLYSLRVAA